MLRITYLIFTFFGLVIILSCSIEDNEDKAQRVRISLREVGNQLLLQQKDSTSLVLPITFLEQSKYRLSFQKAITFEPSQLVGLIQDNFETTLLSRHYRVEVIQCDNDEVAYSYQMSDDEERTIIPCDSRRLPKVCYFIELTFIAEPSSRRNSQIVLFSFGFLTLGFVLFGVYKNRTHSKSTIDQNFVQIGSFKFYKSQNILIKEAEEIALSKKECELLAIFVSRPNETITREELTKRVWEDNGVIVGRSLDTFISKLRKKLQDDDSIKLSNVHGVGYKLELL